MVVLDNLNPHDRVSREKHPYMAELADIFWQIPKHYGIEPTIYFLEAVKYHERAALLQHRNLSWPDVNKSALSGDDLQDQVAIYDTIYRWSAGFSNVPQELIRASRNPKHAWNKKHGYSFDRATNNLVDLMYLLLVHRVTGSGASFALHGGRLAAHGWNNAIVPKLAELGGLKDYIEFIKRHDEPMFSSIGNQVPSFNRPTAPYTTGGREYLCEMAPKLAAHLHRWLTREGAKKTPIQAAVDEALRWQSSQGWRKFHFVLTAWVMDLAEYFPSLVDPDSDCYHGKNAQEALRLVFKPIGRIKHQEFFDRGTRVFADMFKTRPMDVEDAAPGCDLVRWLENYIRPGAYLNVDRTQVFHKCYIKHQAGRQRWKLGTDQWIW